MMALVALTSCRGFKAHFHTDEPLMQQHRNLKGFERIEQLGSIDVKYAQADSFSVVVEATGKMMDCVQTRVEGNKLIVNMKGNSSLFNVDWNDTREVTVYVTSPDFLGIELRGSGDFDCERLLDTDTLGIALKGSGDIKFGSIVCDQANVSLVGSGDVEVGRLTAQRAAADLIGSGDIQLNLDRCGRVEARLKGSGDITLRGNVRNIRRQVIGSGDIDTDGLTVTGK